MARKLHEPLRATPGRSALAEHVLTIDAACEVLPLMRHRRGRARLLPMRSGSWRSSLPGSAIESRR
jgi:hypothetical protein